MWIDSESVFFVQQHYPLSPFLAVVEASIDCVAQLVSEYGTQRIYRSIVFPTVLVEQKRRDVYFESVFLLIGHSIARTHLDESQFWIYFANRDFPLDKIVSDFVKNRLSAFNL
jgi:hypothetical protein